MCGIIGYTGNRRVYDVLIAGLRTLEYRGYDSVGIAVYNNVSAKTEIYKCTGKVENLSVETKDMNIAGNSGIGHTRWATHGGVTKVNAHPHQYGYVTLTHNGIIENYKDLIEQYSLSDKLISETDSEVAAALFNHHYNNDPLETIIKTVSELKGTFAFTIMFANIPDKIYAVRNVSPIVAAHFDEGSVLASDITAVAPFSKDYFVLPEYTVMEMSKEDIRLYDFNKKSITPEYATIDWNVDAVGKCGYPFYMEKEIAEQPEVMKKTLDKYVKDGRLDFESYGLPAEKILKDFSHLYIVGCGTAMHSGLVAKSLLKSLGRIVSSVELASEFIYDKPVIDDKTLVIAISQSGETIDTLEAVKYAKRNGATTISILNVKESSISKVSDYVLYTEAGPEIAVASTKAYVVQLTMIYLLVLKMSGLNGMINEEELNGYLKEMYTIPDKMQKIINDRESIHKLSKEIIFADNLFMLGRGMDYSAILEGSLKLKEISYIHSEAYASGEIKHGPIALITQETPVVAVITQTDVASKEISNVTEVRARGAKVIAIVKEGIDIKDNFIVYNVDKMSDIFMIFQVTVVLQYLAYYTSKDKGYDVDKPRNLAKVVTVE